MRMGPEKDFRKQHLSEDLKNEGVSVNFQRDRTASNGKKLATSEKRERPVWLQYRQQGRMVSDESENKQGQHHRSSEAMLII